jgi:GNAT superfamily N-acetyltransferase
MNTPSAPASPLQTTAKPLPDAPEAPPQWVPVKRLSERWRPQIEDHLLSLRDEDRYLRFGAVASDAMIQAYVNGLRFEHDDVVGVFNRRLQLVAVAHLAFDGGPRPSTAEYGISVSEHLRGMGYGKRLFAHAVLMARHRGVQCLKIHALAENTAMLQIARDAGGTVSREGSDAEATLWLPAPDNGSRWELWLEHWAGDLDFHFKRRTNQPDRPTSGVSGPV